MDYEAPPMPCGCILLLLVFSYSVVSDSFETPWPAGHQAPLSMGFPRQEYWSGLPFLPPGHLPHSGIEPKSPELPVRQEDSLLLSHPGTPPPATHTLHIEGLRGHTQNPGRGPGPCSSLLALGRYLGVRCGTGSQPGRSRGSGARAGKLRRGWAGSQVLRETGASGTGVGNTSSRPHPPAGLRFRRQRQGLSLGGAGEVGTHLGMGLGALLGTRQGGGEKGRSRSSNMLDPSCRLALWQWVTCVDPLVSPVRRALLAPPFHSREH